MRKVIIVGNCSFSFDLRNGEMSPDVKYIMGGPTLPPDFPRPTRDLVGDYQEIIRLGLAAPSAPWLQKKSLEVPYPLTAEVFYNLNRLTRAVGLRGFLKTAVGLAYPQLELGGPSYQAFAVILGLAGLRKQDLPDVPPSLFVNPVVEPIEEMGMSRNYEICMSVPGGACEIMRWKAVRVRGVDIEPRIYEGDDALAIQHENDHLLGYTTVRRAREQGGNIYSVPPELKTAFGEAYRKDRAADWPRVSNAYLDALMSGNFSLANYFQYL